MIQELTEEPQTEKVAEEEPDSFNDSQSKDYKQRVSSARSLVASPMFQYSAYPTPSGSVLRSRSPLGRSRTIVSAKDTHSSSLERAITTIKFEPPFAEVHYMF